MAPFDRGQLISELVRAGIDSRPFFYPLHLMPPYKKYINEGQSFPNAETFGENGLNLPLYPALNEEDIKYISKTINKILLESDYSN
jgi:perosamine synthetase